MKLPLKSYDTNFHIFFASHYVHNWFDPWNPKWYAGFSQTTYPPLPQQWLALISRLIGLDMAYMAVQLVAILLLALGVYRFSLLWVSQRAAALAALASVFLGSECFSRVFRRPVVDDACRASLFERAALRVSVGAAMAGGDRFSRGRRCWLRPLLPITPLCSSGLCCLRCLCWRWPFLIERQDVTIAVQTGDRMSVAAIMFRTGIIALVVGVASSVGASAFLDRADSLPRHADSNSPRQSRELHTKSTVGPELFCSSLWSFNSGVAFYRVARFFQGLQASSIAVWILAGILDRTGRNHSQ